MKVKVAVAGRNASGVPEMVFYRVKVTSAEYNEGLAYQWAEDNARENGYKGPFVSFDDADADWLFDCTRHRYIDI